MPRLQMLYSTSIAVIGCTACARRSCFALHSERPMCLILPSFTSSFSPSIVSSIGT